MNLYWSIQGKLALFAKEEINFAANVAVPGPADSVILQNIHNNCTVLYSVISSCDGTSKI